VDLKQGFQEAVIKFINYDNLVQHCANVFMIWIDFYLNDLSVIFSHFVFMFLWMLGYTLFHSIFWIFTCFLAYPFMKLNTPIVFVWFVGISALHGFFYWVALACSRKKRKAMNAAHNNGDTFAGSAKNNIPNDLLSAGESGESMVESGLIGQSVGNASTGSLLQGVGYGSGEGLRNYEERTWGNCDVNSSSYLMMPA
jgi:hypothetical protein